MNLKTAKFLKSVGLGSSEYYFDDRNEVVFVGRSNMGKSSIMNALFEQKDLVKTSSKPGKTRLANIFLVENKYYFTDLPGYGFAKLGKNLKEELDGLISWYLEERKESIKKVVILIDSKIGPQQSDIDMYKFILDLEMPVLIVLSKIDKLSVNEYKKSLNFAKETFFGQDVIGTSSIKKTGIRELGQELKSSIK